MKDYTLLFLFFWVCLISKAQKVDTASDEFQGLIIKNRFGIEIKENRLIGEGARQLLSEAKESKIFMFGENHGVREIAVFSQLLYNELSKEEPRIVVTEIGPATAAEVTDLLYDDSYEKFLKKGMNLLSVPFFFLEQEVPLLHSVKENFNKSDRPIWGLDQEFMAGAPIVLKQLEKLAVTNEEKKILKKAYRKDFLNPLMIGMGDGKLLNEMEAVFSKSSNPEAKRITEQLVASYEIYQANADGRGKWSNETRETLMMTNFQNYVAHIRDTVPSMYFKFGGYHLHKGASPTVKQALGSRIDAWAQSKNYKTLNVFVDAADGETLNPLLGTKTALPGAKMWRNSVFKRALINDTTTLFNLRVLRGHPAIKRMPKKVQLMINGYDYLLLLPHGRAQNFLPGTLIAYGYGIPILLLVLIVFTMIVIILIKFIKRLRKKNHQGISKPFKTI